MRILAAIFAFLFLAPVAHSQVIDGTNQADRRYGTPRADDISVYDGNDFVWAGSGGDWIAGGRNRDTLYGGSGPDIVIGGRGADRLYAGCDGQCDAGDGNRIYGGAGNDRVFTRNHRRDYVDCGGGDDIVWADLEDNVGNCEEER